MGTEHSPCIHNNSIPSSDNVSVDLTPSKAVKYTTHHAEAFRQKLWAYKHPPAMLLLNICTGIKQCQGATAHWHIKDQSLKLDPTFQTGKGTCALPCEGEQQAEISTGFYSFVHMDTLHWAGESSLWQSHSLLFQELNWIQEVKLICKLLQFSLQSLKLQKKKSSYFCFNMIILQVFILTWIGKDDLLAWAPLFRCCPMWSLWEHLLLGTLRAGDLEPCPPQTPIWDPQFLSLILFHALCQAIEPCS